MPPDTGNQAQAYPFTPAEFERLYAFRQAVLAGFYSDHLPADDGDSQWAEVVPMQERDRSMAEERDQA